MLFFKHNRMLPSRCWVDEDSASGWLNPNPCFFSHLIPYSLVLTSWELNNSGSFSLIKSKFGKKSKFVLFKQ